MAFDTIAPFVRKYHTPPTWSEVPQTVTVIWHDSWRNADRTFRFKGKCVACGRKTWGADDGENDPRGILGDHATHALSAEDYDMTGPDVPLCAMCGNDEGGYRQALHIGQRQTWTRSDDSTDIETAGRFPYPSDHD